MSDQISGNILLHCFSSLFYQRDVQIHLPSDVFQTNPIILPVSVPVKNYQIPSKLNLGTHCHQKDDDQSVQSPLPPVRNQPSCVSI